MARLAFDPACGSGSWRCGACVWCCNIPPVGVTERVGESVRSLARVLSLGSADTRDAYATLARADRLTLRTRRGA